MSKTRLLTRTAVVLISACLFAPELMADSLPAPAGAKSEGETSTTLAELVQVAAEADPERESVAQTPSLQTPSGADRVCTSGVPQSWRWTLGLGAGIAPDYVTDAAFPSDYVPSQQPAMLSYVAARAGYPPPDPARPFRYVELGCGSFSLQCHAAGRAWLLGEIGKIQPHSVIRGLVTITEQGNLKSFKSTCTRREQPRHVGLLDLGGFAIPTVPSASRAEFGLQVN